MAWLGEVVSCMTRIPVERQSQMLHRKNLKVDLRYHGEFRIDRQGVRTCGYGRDRHRAEGSRVGKNYK